MKKRKNKKQIIVITVLIALVLVIILGTYLSKDNDEMTKALKKEGYTTESESAFYKKIVTNNTMDDYYKDISNNKNSKYEEYYFSKQSNDLIEVKLSYQDGVTTNLNITSDLKTEEIEFNYELSYKDAYLILEGNNTDNYVCKPVVKENVGDETINIYCEMIQKEISIFINRRGELLNNEKIKEIINQPVQENIQE